MDKAAGKRVIGVGLAMSFGLGGVALAEGAKRGERGPSPSKIAAPRTSREALKPPSRLAQPSATLKSDAGAPEVVVPADAPARGTRRITLDWSDPQQVRFSDERLVDGEWTLVEAGTAAPLATPTTKADK